MNIQFPISGHPKVSISINGGQELGGWFNKFEWKAMVNGGYIVRCKLLDVDNIILQDIATNYYLQKGCNEPVKVVFEISHPGVVGENSTTGKYLAYLTDLDARGTNKSSSLEFVAVDPPSFWLNAGAASGKVYTGSVKTVIKQVLDEWFAGPDKGEVKVSDTVDSEQNKWWMMRQDPKTFIRSLLDWSAKLTKKQTNWIVSSDGAVSDGNSIHIEEQAAKEVKFVGVFSMNVNTPGGNDVVNFEYMGDTFISPFQKAIITQGISSVSEKYFDRTTDTLHTGDDKECIVHAHWENTPNKYNVVLSDKQAHHKPSNADINSSVDDKKWIWSTSAWMVPEHNAMDVGKKYAEYIDGRARGMYLDMLPLVMRIKFRCFGIAVPNLNCAHNLGVSWLTMKWMQVAPKIQPYFLSGDWMIYGYHHIITRGHWFTDIYCHREYLAKDQGFIPIPGSSADSGRG
jgi:hypothetical protein